jgi:prefoldin alpha subunit
MVKEINKEDIQKNYLELQIIINQINQIQQQILSIQSQANELQNLKESLNRFKKINVNEEAYIPISNNIYTKAKILDNNEFLVAIGSNLLLTKNIDETLLLINQQISDIENIIIELESHLEQLDFKGQQIQLNLSNLDKQ